MKHITPITLLVNILDCLFAFTPKIQRNLFYLKIFAKNHHIDAHENTENFSEEKSQDAQRKRRKGEKEKEKDAL